MNSTEEKTDFTIDQQWKRFLERCGTKPGQLHPIQESEMKRAFYGAAAQILVMVRDDISELSEIDAVSTLESMFNEVADFWENEKKEYDKLQSERKTD